MYAIWCYDTFPLEMDLAAFSEILTTVYLLTRRHIPKTEKSEQSYVGVAGIPVGYGCSDCISSHQTTTAMFD